MIGSNVLPAGSAAAGIADKLVFNGDRSILDELRPYPQHRSCAVRADRSLEVLDGLSDIVDHSEVLCGLKNAPTIYVEPGGVGFPPTKKVGLMMSCIAIAIKQVSL